MCPAVIDDALERAQLSAVPEDAEALVFFATGPLHEAVEASFGEQPASSIMLTLGPVLDEVWVRERRRVVADPDSAFSTAPTSETARRESGVRRQAERDDETPTDIEQLVAADTIPAPNSGAAEAAAAELALRMSAHPSVAISEAPPSSNRFTVPYLPNALLPESRTPAVVVADADDDSRGELSDWLHSLGCLVARATNRAQVRSLVRKLKAQVLIADVETIAPDFEPLRPTFDDLFPGLTRPKVILISDGVRRELPDKVLAVLPRPVQRDQLLDLVAPLVAEPDGEH